MKKARVLVHGIEAGILETIDNQSYQFVYHPDYQGPPVSLTMPITNSIYAFDKFPAFFEGLLPEGMMLEALLRKYKIDRTDYFEPQWVTCHIRWARRARRCGSQNDGKYLFFNFEKSRSKY